MIEGALGDLPDDLWDGELHLDGNLFKMIPIPLEYKGDVTLDLQCNGQVHISGQAIRLELIGAPEYIEEFEGHPT